MRQVIGTRATQASPPPTSATPAPTNHQKTIKSVGAGEERTRRGDPWVAPGGGGTTQKWEQDEGDASVPTPTDEQWSAGTKIEEKILTKEQYDPSKHNRQSIRLPSYDYSS